MPPDSLSPSLSNFMAKDAIKIYNTFGELVRTYTADESDERADYTEKADEFLKKHPGYTTDGTVTEEKPGENGEGSDTQIGSGDQSVPAASKGKAKAPAASKGKA